MNIISDNVELMLSSKLDGMISCLLMESLRGNAGYYKGKPCAGVNFVLRKNPERACTCAGNQE